MPPKKAVKAVLPGIPWSNNNDELVWLLLTECEKPANYKILFGKKTKTENTSADTKVAVFKRMASAVIPELFAVDEGTAANRLKGKLERQAQCFYCLTKTYRKHAQRLKQTGGGLDDGDESQAPDEDSGEEYLKYYIPGEGPNDSTPEEALNLWEQIKKEFKFFPRLHKIYASRPNVIPIVVTTALGPQGRKTIWYQSPDDRELDGNPPLPPPQSPAADASPPRGFGEDITSTAVNDASMSSGPPSRVATAPDPTPAPSLPISTSLPSETPSAKRPPKSSGASREAIDKARSYIEKVPQKRSLLDTIIEMNEANTKLWSEEAKEKLSIQKRTHALEEFKLGLIDKDEYKLKIAEIDGNAPPPKRQRLSSPDWDNDVFGTED